MILCVDCGNTLIKIGSLEDGKVMAPIIRIETSLNKTMYEYASDIDRILRLLKIPVHDAEGVVLSSVVPPLTDILSDALHLITGKRALVVGVGTKTGLKLQIDDPGTVAADLVTAAVGAKKSCPLPAIIVTTYYPGSTTIRRRCPVFLCRAGGPSSAGNPQRPGW